MPCPGLCSQRGGLAKGLGDEDGHEPLLAMWLGASSVAFRRGERWKRATEAAGSEERCQLSSLRCPAPSTKCFLRRYGL